MTPHRTDSGDRKTQAGRARNVTLMTQQPVEVTGMWLHSEGDDLHVAVEVDGQWRRIMTEGRHGPISHITEPAGIRSAPLDPTGRNG